MSRNGNTFSRFAPFSAELARDIHVREAILDGEVCVFDRKGRPQFADLFDGRGTAMVRITFD